MRYIDRYPIIVTAARAGLPRLLVAASRVAVVFENEWFAYLAAEGAAIAFMSPDHPSSPPGPERVRGRHQLRARSRMRPSRSKSSARLAGRPD